MKKCVSIFIAMLLSISIAAPAFASGLAYDASAQGSVMLIDGAFAQADSGDSEIAYSGLTVQTADDMNYTMEFILQVGENNYPIEVSGVLKEYTMGHSANILHGCLRGSAIIDDISYNVTVGLTKEVGNSSINAGVVLMPCGDTWSDDVIIFGMGDYVVSPTLSSLIAGDEATNISAPINIQTQQEISNALDVSAQVLSDTERSVSVHVNLNTSQIQGYIFEHFSYTGAGGGVTYSLSEIQVGAREWSEILNLDGPHFPVGSDLIETDVNPTDFKNIIWAIVCDALCRYDIPTSTMTSLISLLSERKSNPYEVIQYADNNWITLSGSGIYSQIWDCGLACTFATGPTSSMTPGVATVTGYGNATFRIVQNIPLSGAISFYLDAAEATDNVAVRVG